MKLPAEIASEVTQRCHLKERAWCLLQSIALLDSHGPKLTLIAPFSSGNIFQQWRLSNIPLHCKFYQLSPFHQSFLKTPSNNLVANFKEHFLWAKVPVSQMLLSQFVVHYDIVHSQGPWCAYDAISWKVNSVVYLFFLFATFSQCKESCMEKSWTSGQITFISVNFVHFCLCSFKVL